MQVCDAGSATQMAGERCRIQSVPVRERASGEMNFLEAGMAMPLALGGHVVFIPAQHQQCRSPCVVVC